MGASLLTGDFFFFTIKELCRSNGHILSVVLMKNLVPAYIGQTDMFVMLESLEVVIYHAETVVFL